MSKVGNGKLKRRMSHPLHWNGQRYTGLDSIQKIQIDALYGLLMNDNGYFDFTIRYSLEIFQICLMEH